MLHPRDYIGKFNIRWEPEAFLSVIRQDLAQVNPEVDSEEWILDSLVISNPRCARWSAIWWLLSEYQPVPEWVWQDAAWILSKGDLVLVNPVAIYAFFDFVESRLEQDRLKHLYFTPRVPSISQTTLGHEISLISACIFAADQGKTKIRWGMGTYNIEEMVKRVFVSV